MALTKVQTIGIETGISLTGVTTVTTLNASTDTLSVGGTVNFGGNVSIAGTLTYEDVTNIDAVGIITARSAIALSEDNAIHFRGVVTDDADAILRASASGGQLLINSRNDTIINIDSNNDSSDAHFAVAHGAATGSSTEVFRVQEDGKIGIGTANPGERLHLTTTSGNCKLRIDAASAASVDFYNAGTRFSDMFTDASTGNFTITNRQNADIIVRTNGTNERLRIDSSGRLLVGASSSRTVGGNIAGKLQIEGTGTGGSTTACTVTQNSNDSTGGRFMLAKSRGTSTGSITLVQSGDQLGMIDFAGADGTNAGSSAVRIIAEVDGTPGENDMPGRLVFQVTADGASSPTERMRIKSDGTLHVIKSGTQITNVEQTVAVFQRSSASGSTSRISIVSGNAASSQIQFGDTDDENVGIIHYDHADNSMRFSTNTSERMRITSAGFLGLNTSSPATDLHISGSSPHIDLGPQGSNLSKIGFASLNMYLGTTSSGGEFFFKNNISSTDHPQSSGTVLAKITSGGELLVGKTSSGVSGNGGELRDGSSDYAVVATAGGHIPLIVNRNTDDGGLVRFRQANSDEGTISISGSTVSYNGAHLSRWSQLAGGAARTEILRGSVLSNLNEMCEWGEENNEQLNRMKVSDVEGDPKVAGVFQDWDDDDDTYTNDFYCAMTGDFVIRIAQGTTVANGDLLMSAGDGTAKPQGDDIVRSKTVAKVTSTTVSATYSDGSYCVPCVLMAC